MWVLGVVVVWSATVRDVCVTVGIVGVGGDKVVLR
jgi:hypothetical protein